jgi:hypothetical protein
MWNNEIISIICMFKEIRGRFTIEMQYVGHFIV